MVGLNQCSAGRQTNSTERRCVLVIIAPVMLLSRLRAWQATTTARHRAAYSLANTVGEPHTECRPRAPACVPRGSRANESTRSGPRPTRNGALRCLHLEALGVHEQRQLLQLDQMIHRARHADSQRTLVACRVVCDAPTAETLPQTFTGVNYAMHAITNAHCGGHALKGLLKGCAEQNALGTVAAHGVPYASIAQVFLVSSAVGDALAGNDARGCSKGALYPCPECWDHLLAVAQMRQAITRSPLEFFTVLPHAQEHMLSVVRHFDTVMAGDTPPPITVTLVTA